MKVSVSETSKNCLKDFKERMGFYDSLLSDFEFDFDSAVEKLMDKSHLLSISEHALESIKESCEESEFLIYMKRILTFNKYLLSMKPFRVAFLSFWQGVHLNLVCLGQFIKGTELCL